MHACDGFRTDQKESSGGRHRFHSVELPLKRHKLKYQCRLRKNAMASMFVLVKEDSDILNWLHEGDVLTMTFYGNDLATPPEDLETEIKYIAKNDSGKFKGHYQVGLDIIHDHGRCNGSPGAVPDRDSLPMAS